MYFIHDIWLSVNTFCSYVWTIDTRHTYDEYLVLASKSGMIISESVTVTLIYIHPTEEEPDQHIVCVAPGVPCMTTVREVTTKWKSGPYSRDEVLAPSDARPGSHPGLPHSPFDKPPQSREVRLDEVVTRLLGLSGPIKPDMWSVQIKDFYRGQNDAVLSRHRRRLPHWNLRIATTLSPPLPSEWSTFP
jgi:hypothetical protein